MIPALWLLSFLGSFLFFPLSDSVQTAAVVTMLLSLVGYVASTGERTFNYTPLSILMILLWVVTAISVACSEVPFISLTYFFFFSVFPLTFLLFSFENPAGLFKPIRWITLLLGIGSLVQFYFMPHMLKFGGTHWPLADNNSLAVILAVGVVLCIGEALRGGKGTYYHIAAAVILLAGIMTTGGTAVFFGLFLVLGVFTWLVRPPTFKPVGIFIGAALMLMLVMYPSQLSLYHFFQSWSGTVHIFVEGSLGETNDVSGSRLMIWESTFEIFKRHAGTGTGIGTFFLYYPEFRDFNDNSAGFMAHNDLLQIAAETGFMGPVLALCIIGYVSYGTFATLRRSVTVDDRLKVMIPFAAFGLIIGHSLVNFNMYVLPTLMLTGIFLAAWNAQSLPREMKMAGTKTVREAVCFTVLMLACVPLWGCYLSEYYTSRATDALAEGRIQGFSDDLNMADRWGAGQNGRAVLQAAKFASATEHDDRALVLLDRAQNLNPRLVQIYVERARIWGIHDPAKGLAEAQKALQMDNGSIAARMVIADCLERMNQPQEAYNVLKEGLKGYLRVRDQWPYLNLMAAKSLQYGDMKTNREALLRLRNLGY